MEENKFTRLVITKDPYITFKATSQWIFTCTFIVACTKGTYIGYMLFYIHYMLAWLWMTAQPGETGAAGNLKLNKAKGQYLCLSVVQYIAVNHCYRQQKTGQQSYISLKDVLLKKLLCFGCSVRELSLWPSSKYLMIRVVEENSINKSFNLLLRKERHVCAHISSILLSVLFASPRRIFF